MKNNILVHNLPEEATENIEQRVLDLFQTKLNIDPNTILIERAHRIGPRLSGRPRLVVININRYKDVEQILQLSRENLPKGRNTVFLTQQLPTEILETRKSLYAVADQLKEGNPGVKCVVKKDKLYVNNELHRQVLPTPTPGEIINIPTNDKKELVDKVRIFEGEAIKRQGSSFIACLTKIQSMDDARAAYKRTLLHPAYMAATHNIACAILYNPFTAKCQTAYSDDCEWGAGKVICQHLLQRNVHNVAVIVRRQYGGSHLGKDRFALIKEAVDSALATYNDHTE